MSAAHEIESVSTQHLLQSLTLAVDEAKLVRSLIHAQQLANRMKKESPFSERLIYLTREINYLKQRLVKVRTVAAQKRERLRREASRRTTEIEPSAEKPTTDWEPI